MSATKTENELVKIRKILAGVYKLLLKVHGEDEKKADVKV